MRGKLLYEGKAKQVFQSAENEQELVLSYKNDATAFNGKKKASFEGKGRYNNLISTHIFEYLKNQGISSHFIKPLSETEQLVKKTTIVPLEVVVRNVAAGSITRRLGIPEKTVFQPVLTELYYKDDSLDDPIINDAHALLLTDVNEEELAFIKQAALEVNQHLQTFFDRVGSDWSISNLNSAVTTTAPSFYQMKSLRIHAGFGTKRMAARWTRMYSVKTLVT